MFYFAFVLHFLCSVYYCFTHLAYSVLVRQQLDKYQWCGLRSSSRKSAGCSTNSGQWQVTAYADTNGSPRLELSYLCTVFNGCPLAKLAYMYFFASNWTTTNITNFVPPQAKARQVLLFLVFLTCAYTSGSRGYALLSFLHYILWTSGLSVYTRCGVM